MNVHRGIHYSEAPEWKEHKCSSIVNNDEKNQMWHIHTMEYYSATKRNEILTDG